MNFLLLTLLLQQSLSDGRTPAQIRLVPVTEEEAVAEFEKICFTGLQSLAALQEALKASAWGYRSEAATLEGFRSNWSSVHGELNYIRRIPGQSALPLPQCNLTTLTRGAVDEQALRASVEAMLARQLGSAPTASSKGTSLSWTWAAPGGAPVSLYRLHAEPGGQQIDLSLQSGPGFGQEAK
ncbi:MAG TPA: hypothetical protein VGW34_06245 [Allosphingosinicella sp.]|nr:hypothetical protein [Allosphingosinicella sp.]